MPSHQIFVHHHFIYGQYVSSGIYRHAICALQLYCTCLEKRAGHMRLQDHPSPFPSEWDWLRAAGNKISRLSGRSKFPAFNFTWMDSISLNLCFVKVKQTLEPTLNSGVGKSSHCPRGMRCFSMSFPLLNVFRYSTSRSFDVRGTSKRQQSRKDHLSRNVACMT